MTSSLVGSEMCIRDSNKLAEMAEKIGVLPSGLGQDLWSHCFRAYNQQAVSYTHLTLPTICSV
eukprot:9849990-Prorocentrum_lima.AAC.1